MAFVNMFRGPMLALTAGLALALAGGRANAQPQADPDWPCQQILVPELSGGQMWSGPSLDGLPPAPNEEKFWAVVRKLIDKDVPIETAGGEVDIFLASAPGERQQMVGMLFVASLDEINHARSKMIDGLKRYGRNQRALAKQVSEENRALQQLQGTGGAADQVAQLQAARDWDTRLFTDRQKTGRNLCDQPVQLEQRAFAIARLLQEKQS